MRFRHGKLDNAEEFWHGPRDAHGHAPKDVPCSTGPARGTPAPAPFTQILRPPQEQPGSPPISHPQVSPRCQCSPLRFDSPLPDVQHAQFSNPDHLAPAIRNA